MIQTDEVYPLFEAGYRSVNGLFQETNALQSKTGIVQESFSPEYDSEFNFLGGLFCQMMDVSARDNGKGYLEQRYSVRTACVKVNEDQK